MDNKHNSNESELTELLRNAIRNVMRNSLIYDGIIINTSEAETKFVVDVQLSSDGNPTYFEVPLKVMKNSQASVIEIPALNSNCIICFRDGNAGRPQILFVDRVLKFLVNCNSIVFNNGSNGGLVNVVDVVKAYNAIQDDVNNLKNLIGSWVPVSGDGGASLKTTLATWTGTPLHKTVRKDIEDTKVTH